MPATSFLPCQVLDDSMGFRTAASARRVFGGRTRRRRSRALGRAVAGVEPLETRMLLTAAPVLGDVGGTRSFNPGGPAIAVDSDLTITSPDAGATLDGASVTIGGGFAASEDQLSFSSVAGITGAYNASSGVLTFTGVAPIGDYQAILRSVSYTDTSATPSLAPRTVSITLSAGPLFNPATGHFYDFIDRHPTPATPQGISWTQAKAEAETMTLFGLQGYLATMTSAQENDFAASKLLETGWIGGSDAATEGDWRWKTGPEGLEDGGLGRQFWQGKFPAAGGGPVNGEYSNWNSRAAGGSDDEPNDIHNVPGDDGEDYAHMIFNPVVGPLGTWNDLANFGPFAPYIPFGYLIEYGGMAGDPELHLAGSVTININQAPTITSLSGDSIQENQVATVSGTFTDPGVGDVHTVTVDWGEGAAESFTLAAGARSFTLTHQYLDDNPTGTGSDTYAVSVTVADDKGGSDSGSTSVAVANVAPVATALASSSPECGGAMAGDAVTVAGTFTDVGTQDTHAASIDWGDGSTATAGSVVEAGGSGTVGGSHVYAAGGIYTITLTLKDDDGGTTTRSAQAVIGGVGVVNGQLQIIGTERADHVTVNRTGNGVYRVHADFLGSGPFVDVPGTGITSILAVLCDGDDHFNTAGSIDVLTIVDGGEGDDELNGPNGGGILLGGPGNDQLNGGSGRDLMIGGDGADRIVGNRGDDLLIAGTTVFDENYGGLVGARAGSVALHDGNVFDDGDTDVLTGSAGFDTIFFNKDFGVRDKVTDDAEVGIDID